MAHLKRISTPRTWRILRKVKTFITKPNPGAHSLTHALSINTILKEQIGLATKTKETKKILHDKEVLIDGKRRRDHKHNTGFMDVISIPEIKKHYRVTFDDKGKLTTIEIKETEAKIKPCKITGKKTIKGNKTQIILSDGRTIITDNKEYKTGDTLVITIPEQEIKQHIPLKKGVTAMIYKGKYTGQIGTIEQIEGDSVIIKKGDELLHTKKEYTYVIGENKPIISVAQ